GFYSTDGERRVWALGVRHAVIPKPGFRSRERIDHERQRWFRRGRAWRAGGEARIARLKHCFGMARSRYRGERGMVRTVYWAASAPCASHPTASLLRLPPHLHLDAARRRREAPLRLPADRHEPRDDREALRRRPRRCRPARRDDR